MKRSSSVSLLLILSFSVSLLAQSIWKDPKNQTWKTATGVEQYEQLMWKAAKDKDWLAVESHMASNFIYVDTAGTKDKAQRLADLRQLSSVDTEMKDAVVTPSGNHAIVTYTQGAFRIMSLWQQQKSGWVLVAMSSTSIR